LRLSFQAARRLCISVPFQIIYDYVAQAFRRFTIRLTLPSLFPSYPTIFITLSDNGPIHFCEPAVFQTLSGFAGNQSVDDKFNFDSYSNTHTVYKNFHIAKYLNSKKLLVQLLKLM
jgi:hypothetical protein